MSTVAPHGQCLAKVSLGQPLPTTIHRKHTFGKKRIPLRKRITLRYVLRVQSQAGFGRGTLKMKEEAIEVEAESEPSSGTKKFINFPGTIDLPGTDKLQAKGQSQAKSNEVIFVAGATGKVGSRTVRELLKLGFIVRAGTRNVEKAQALFEDVTQNGPLTAGSDDATPFGFFSPAKLFGFLKPKPGKMLEIVECDLEDAESIEPALGNAGVVVCCIGASEKEVLDVSGPYRIDFKATANLIDAASSAQVNHFVLVTSLGTQKFGLPAAVLNLFWGVLVWKAKAEKALLESGLRYTIVRPGGMERPTDAYKETHNLLLAEADKLFGGQVSNLQVAELLASIVENPDVSVNKIIEAVAETTAPLRPIRELLEEISAKDDTVSSLEPQSIGKTRPPMADVTPQKVSKKKDEEKLAEERRALALKEKEEKRIQAEKLAEEKLAKSQKEKEEKRIRAENDEKEKLRLQTLRKKYEEEIEVAMEKEEAANSAAAAALAEKAELEKRVAEVRAKAEAAALAASQAKAVEAAVLAAARKGNVLSDAEKEKIMEAVKLARLSKEDGPKESKPSSKKKPAFSFFGKAAPSAETATDIESPKEMKEEQAKLEAESKAKAEKEAAAKLAEQKKQEEKAKTAAAKFAEQEAAKALEAKQKEEQDRLEKEAKEQAEKEAAEAKRIEAEAKRKEEEEDSRRKEEEAEAKRKEEEAKRKEEEEDSRRKEEEAKVKRKDEAEAKRKEEEEDSRRKEEEAEVKRKEEAEAKRKEAAEAKRKEEEIAEARRKEEEAEVKRKDEAEAKRKEEEEDSRRKEEAAEVKRKEEAEAKRKEAAEAKRKEEEIAEAKKKEEEIAEAKKKEEQEKAEREVEKLQIEAEEKVKALAEQEAAAAAAEAEKKAVQKEEEPKEAPAPGRRKGFRWFWQPAEPDTFEEEKTTKADVPGVPIAKVTQQLPPSSTPLSPYTRYPGLKPPFPPIASPPTAKAEKVDIPKIEPVSLEINRVEQTKEEVGLIAKKDEEVIVEEPSPEFLEDIEARAQQVQEIAAREREAFEKAQAAISLKWLWQKRDLVEENSASTSKEKEAVASCGASKSDALPRSSRPLSPYAQFPDLKPPAPPRASLPVLSITETEFKAVETLPKSSTSLSPYPGFPELKPQTVPTPLRNGEENGAVPESTVEQEEKIAESAFTSGFKWPWQQ